MLLIDGSNIYWRCAFVFQDEGLDGIITGVMQSLAKVLRENPDQSDVNIAWDTTNRMRRAIWEGYKDREADETVTQLYEYLQPVRDVCSYLIPCVTSQWEADDVIATAVDKEPGEHLVYSGDQDLWMLLEDGKCSILQPVKGSGWEVYTESTFRMEHGFAPARYVWVKVVKGCKSDTVPGIKYLRTDKLHQVIAGMTDESIDGLLESVKQNAPRWVEKFHDPDNLELLRRNYQLVRLRKDVSLERRFSRSIPKLRRYLGSLPLTDRAAVTSAAASVYTRTG